MKELRRHVDDQNQSHSEAAKQLDDGVERLLQMVADFMRQPNPVLPEEFDHVLTGLRDAWPRLSKRTPRDRRISLAVLHGLAERSAWGDLSRQAMAFFQRNLRFLEQEEITGQRVENEGARLGLPVCDTEETVEGVAGHFGYVDTIDGQRARVVLLDEHEKDSIADLWIPVNWLPRAYREDGAGIAWIERKYRSGVKGRFEPASAGE